MQYTSPRRRQGFTLVEVAVIMPMAVLLIGAMIGTILYLTNVSLRTQGKSKQQVEVITSLDRMEQDVRNAMSITMDGGQLKIVALATNKDPLNTDRQLINKGDCSLGNVRIDPRRRLTIHSNIPNATEWRPNLACSHDICRLLCFFV